MAGRPFVRAAAGSGDRWRRPGWCAALVAAVALAAASCSGSTGPVPSSSLPKTTLTACTQAGRSAECGYVPNARLVTVPDSGHATLILSPHPACLLAGTTAFIQAGQPASPAAWDACTRTLAAEPVPFPAP